MSGLEFVQGLANGTLPLNTIAQTLGYDVSEAVRGRVVVTAEPSSAHLNPAGTVHGGLAATLLDSCMGLAIRSTLEKGIGQTTLEFKISLVRPITPETGLDQGRRRRPELRPPHRDRRKPDQRWPRGACSLTARPHASSLRPDPSLADSGLHCAPRASAPTGQFTADPPPPRGIACIAAMWSATVLPAMRLCGPRL